MPQGYPLLEADPETMFSFHWPKCPSFGQKPDLSEPSEIHTWLFCCLCPGKIGVHGLPKYSSYYIFPRVECGMSRRQLVKYWPGCLSAGSGSSGVVRQCDRRGTSSVRGEKYSAMCSSDGPWSWSKHMVCQGWTLKKRRSSSWT